MTGERTRVARRSVAVGIAASLTLLSLYFTIVTLAQDFAHAVQTFRDLWYWITALVTGFGVQGGLYYYIRASLTAKGSAASVAACGGMSTTAMVACCAHHVSDVLPFFGLSAAAVFLTEYQQLFIILGLLSNFVGIVFMLSIVQKNKLMDEKGMLVFLFKLDMRQAFKASAVAAAVIFGVLLMASLGDKISLTGL